MSLQTATASELEHTCTTLPAATDPGALPAAGAAAPQLPSPAVLELPSRWSRPSGSDQTVTTNEWKVALTDLASLHARQVILYGADFFSRPDALELLSAATAFGMEIAIFTDIVPTTPDFVEALSTLKIAGLWLTLYGARRETHDAVAGAGSFDRTLEIMSCLRARQQPVRLNAALGQWDPSALVDLVDLASRTECPITSDVFSAQREGALARPAIWVMPDGTVRPCRALGPAVGTVLYDSLADLWHHSQILHALAGSKVAPSPGCQQCQLRASCFHESDAERSRV